MNIFIINKQELKATTVTTANKFFRGAAMDVYREYDVNKKLSYYSPDQLYNIFQQRSALTFVDQVNENILHYVTDLIFEHHVPVPGKGVELLKRLYATLVDKQDPTHEEVINICQGQFESAYAVDEFTILSIVSDQELLMLMFLDNVANFFLRSKLYYVPRSELEDLYVISTEFISSDASVEEFRDLLKKTIYLGVISRSKQFKKEDQYFLVINPQQLNAVIGAIMMTD